MGALASEYFSGTEDLNRHDSTVTIGIFSKTICILSQAAEL
jgi:hypothetical protein